MIDGGIRIPRQRYISITIVLILSSPPTGPMPIAWRRSLLDYYYHDCASLYIRPRGYSILGLLFLGRDTRRIKPSPWPGLRSFGFSTPNTRTPQTLIIIHSLAFLPLHYEATPTIVLAGLCPGAGRVGCREGSGLTKLPQEMAFAWDGRDRRRERAA
ncbi:hypothetical protein QBC45DRAFT_71894 [Copromyces sp. CBS 386.78]|nr:hypothetical protein QBC45DRAFT_71894 [Copromyces sp. CBS 386.78]